MVHEYRIGMDLCMSFYGMDLCLSVIIVSHSVLIRTMWGRAVAVEEVE